MKSYKIYATAICIIFCLTFTGAEAAESGSRNATKDPVNVSKQDDVASRATPSQEKSIDVLGPLLGDWNLTITVPGENQQQDTVSQALATSEWQLGKRFLSTTEKGMINIGGDTVPFNVQRYTGFNKATGRYQSTSMSTFSTEIVNSSGTFDEKMKTITTSGDFTNPSHGKAEKFREVLQLIDSKHYTRTFFSIDKAGKEAKLATFDYTKD